MPRRAVPWPIPRLAGGRVPGHLDYGHRTRLRRLVRVRPAANSTADNTVRQGRTTAPNFNRPLVMQLYINNVELHRPTVYQQCRTPSTNRISTMSNSINHRSFTMAPTVNNVEFHRQSHCMSSPAMSNSIDQVVSPSQWCLHQQCRTQTRRIE